MPVHKMIGKFFSKKVDAIQGAIGAYKEGIISGSEMVMQIRLASTENLDIVQAIEKFDDRRRGENEEIIALLEKLLEEGG